MHEFSKDNKILGLASSAILAILILLVITSKHIQSENELKGKLLLGGVTANSVQCTINYTPASCASAAAEDVKVAKEIRVSNPIPRPVSNANVQLGSSNSVNSPDVD